MNDLAFNLFASLLAELAAVFIAIIVKDDKRKAALILAGGTALAGIFYFLPQILQNIGVHTTPSTSIQSPNDTSTGSVTKTPPKVTTSQLTIMNKRESVYDLITKMAYISRYICRKSSDETLPSKMTTYLFSTNHDVVDDIQGRELLQNIKDKCRSALTERNIDWDYYSNAFSEYLSQLCFIYDFKECEALPAGGKILMSERYEVYTQLADEGERRWEESLSNSQ